MEFSGVRPPKLAIVVAESCALLKRFWSAAVPKKTLPLALNLASRPLPLLPDPPDGGGEEVEVGGVLVVAPVPEPAGKHWK